MDDYYFFSFILCTYTEAIRDKFNNLKTYYYKKNNDRIKSGSSGSEFRDSWVHYSELKFLSENTTPAKSLNNFEAVRICSFNQQYNHIFNTIFFKEIYWIIVKLYK